MPTPLRPPKRAMGNDTSEINGRRIVRERSGGLCELALPDLCLGRAAGVHHRIKRGQGGSWAPSNLLDACGSGTMGCHGWVEAHPKDANAIGLWLHANDVSTEVPALVRWGGQRSRWFLEDDGTLRWDNAEDNVYADIIWGPGAVTKPPTPWGEL